MSNSYWSGKLPKKPPKKSFAYKSGSSCIVLTMQDRVEIATLFSILLNVERRLKDGTKKKNSNIPPKIKSSHISGLFYCLIAVLFVRVLCCLRIYYMYKLEHM